MDSLLEKLKNNNRIPMHMPGHKRNIEFAEFLKDLRANLDITEIDGFDNLSNPEEVLLNSMKKASEIWNSKKSYFLVGGSTCGILAGFKSLTKDGDTVLMCRNSHKSMYHALELLGLKSQFIQGEIYNSRGKYEIINPKDIEKAIFLNKDIKLVAITSPTYEGYVQNASEISRICHDNNIPLLVDEAHGSHLGFTEYFPKSAIQLGADFVVQSLHKTSLGLTQTAICHISGDIVSSKKLEHNLSIFQTSSPSYLLLASICQCIDLLENKEIFKNWEYNLDKIYLMSNELKHLKINQDINKEKSKILIDCSKSNITGKELMQLLRQKYNIELEMACADYAIAMTGLADKKEDIDYFIKAILDIDKSLQNNEKEIFALENFQKNPVITIKQALEQEKVFVSMENSIGKISGTHLWVYPPGIPIVIAGEIITKEHIKMLKKLENYGSEIIDLEKKYPKITILK